MAAYKFGSDNAYDDMASVYARLSGCGGVCRGLRECCLAMLSEAR